MKFSLVLDYTLPSTCPKSTQAEIQNDGGNVGYYIMICYITQNSLPFVSFDKEGIIYVFIKTVLP